jgi:DNA replication protein DnaC
MAHRKSPVIFHRHLRLIHSPHFRPARSLPQQSRFIMRRYERFSTLLTSNRPVEDWGQLLGDIAAASAMLDRLLHHGHVLKCGPRSWRTKAAAAP